MEPAFPSDEKKKVASGDKPDICIFGLPIGAPQLWGQLNPITTERGLTKSAEGTRFFRYLPTYYISVAVWD